MLCFAALVCVRLRKREREKERTLANDTKTDQTSWLYLNGKEVV